MEALELGSHERELGASGLDSIRESIETDAQLERDCIRGGRCLVGTVNQRALARIGNRCAIDRRIRGPLLRDGSVQIVWLLDDTDGLGGLRRVVGEGALEKE